MSVVFARSSHEIMKEENIHTSDRTVRGDIKGSRKRRTREGRADWPSHPYSLNRTRKRPFLVLVVSSPSSFLFLATRGSRWKEKRGEEGREAESGEPMIQSILLRRPCRSGSVCGSLDLYQRHSVSSGLDEQEVISKWYHCAMSDLLQSDAVPSFLFFTPHVSVFSALHPLSSLSSFLSIIPRLLDSILRLLHPHLGDCLSISDG